MNDSSKIWRGLLAAALLLTAGAASASWLRPLWTRVKPHYETRAGRRYAVAVGRAQDQNIPLARSAAEERGRAALLRFLQNKPPFADLEGRVKGAVPAAFYEAGDGTVYARLELELKPAP